MGTVGRLILAGTVLAAIASMIAMYDSGLAAAFVGVTLLALALRSGKFLDGLTEFVKTFGGIR